MQIDKEALSRILKLDDDAFKSKVRNAASASGIEQDKLEKVLKDVSSLKQTLAGISEDDLKRAATVIGTDKIEEIMKNVKNNVK